MTHQDWYGWESYLTADLDDVGDVANYLKMLEDGEEFGFLADGPEFALALGCLHTHCAERLGVTRETFAAMVSLEDGDKFRFGVWDEIVVYIDDGGGVAVVEGPCVGVTESSDRMTPASRSCKAQWVEPWPGAREDLPLDFVGDVVDTGSYHMAIFKVKTVFGLEHLPAIIDKIKAAGGVGC